MSCPICKSKLYEKSRNELTNGTMIEIRCTNKTCNYFDYKNVPVNFENTITEE